MFLECVNMMMPYSQNTIDMFLKEIIDIKHFSTEDGIKQILKAVCNMSTIEGELA